MRATKPETIPAFLSFDVEPDAFQLSRGQTDVWPGYGAHVEFARTLRRELERASGARPRFGWYYRMDPQIEHACGRADDAVAGFPERIASLRDEGDDFGVHAHPIRWSSDRGLWVHDVADARWLREFTAFSLDAFEASMGARARLYRLGGGFLSNDMVDVLDGRGVEFELGLEPVASWGLEATEVRSGIDASPIVGRFTDCSTAPRTPYRPDPADFRRPGGADARRIAFVPVTTVPRRLPPTGVGLAVRHMLGRPPRPRSTRVLYPTGAWPSDRYFWDLAAHRLATMERPYLSLGVRTDAPGSALTTLVCRRLMALTRHPLVKRLRFVSPLDVAERLLPRRADPVVGTTAP